MMNTIHSVAYNEKYNILKHLLCKEHIPRGKSFTFLYLELFVINEINDIVVAEKQKSESFNIPKNL